MKTLRLQQVNEIFLAVNR